MSSRRRKRSVTADTPCGAVTLALDPDRRLALAYVPAARRGTLDSLWRLDVTLGSVLATGRDSMISRIRLAWWREALERLDRERPPAEPMLGAAAHRILPNGITGAELAAMVDGWEVLLDDGAPGAEVLAHYASTRGGLLFRYSARLLGDSGHPVEKAGECWALVDLARHSARNEEAAAAMALAREPPVKGRWPKALRPLGMLAAMAERDARRAGFERQGSPGRMLRMARHRLTGR